MKREPTFYVRPRYTPGSPGMVPQHLAERIAKEEKEAYEDALSGRYGQGDVEKAQQKGLFGIAESKIENQRRKGWEVHDLITGETYFRPFDKR